MTESTRIFTKSNPSVEDNIQSLTLLAEAMVEIDYFIFFGTLLGLTREGAPIKGDDDVDFYVNTKDRDALITKLNELDIEIELDFPNNTQHFLNVQKDFGDHKLSADFYFFDAETDDDYLLERWNFNGDHTNPRNTLKLPKIFVYPIAVEIYRNTPLKLPNHTNLVNEFLYGPDWRIPIKKDVEYISRVAGGRPILLIKDQYDTEGQFQLLIWFSRLAKPRPDKSRLSVRQEKQNLSPKEINQIRLIF